MLGRPVGRVVRGDGDGWVECGDGRRRWGRFGAAGLLLRAPDPDGGPEPLVLLQLRVGWSHHGGTWGLPGGARDSHESATEAALREAVEEAGIDPGAVSPRALSVDDLGGDPSGWTYTTVVADAAAPLPTVANHESDELRWVPESSLPGLPLHPGLRASWPVQRAPLATLVLDTANVLGAVPDGWWRDRVASTGSLVRAVASALPRTLELPEGGFRWLTDVVAVVEGRARELPDRSGPAGLAVVRAVGSGDDALVDVVSELRAAGRTPVVATADRGLRERLPRSVAVLGPTVVRGWGADRAA